MKRYVRPIAPEPHGPWLRFTRVFCVPPGYDWCWFARLADVYTEVGDDGRLHVYCYTERAAMRVEDGLT